MDMEVEGTVTTKALRVGDPDVTIILRYREEESEEPQTKKYPMYGTILASHSSFFDAALSVEMKEKETREVVLDDVTPEIFELGIQVLQDPLASRSLKADNENTLKLAEFYDKYEFRKGLSLCDEIMADYIEQAQNILDEYDYNPHFPIFLNLVVEATMKAHSHNMPKTKTNGVDNLRGYFDSTRHPGPTVFLERHIEILQPMFVEGIFDSPEGFTAEELESPLFPKYLVKCAASHFYASQFKTVKICGSRAEGTYNLSDGNFITERSGTWPYPDGESAVRFWIGNYCEAPGWGIYCAKTTDEDNIKLLWTYPNSGNLDFPPKGPWIPTCEEAEEMDMDPPRIEY